VRKLTYSGVKEHQFYVLEASCFIKTGFIRSFTLRSVSGKSAILPKMMFEYVEYLYIYLFLQAKLYLNTKLKAISINQEELLLFYRQTTSNIGLQAFVNLIINYSI